MKIYLKRCAIICLKGIHSIIIMLIILIAHNINNDNNNDNNNDLFHYNHDDLKKNN